jgi:hypothetical protein
MTPAEEREFIALWNAGTETAEIGRQLGIPRGTVSSRAYTLVRQGKIQARPKGGHYPRRTAQGRHTPPDPPVQSSAEQDSAEQSGAGSPPTALVPAVASAAIIDLLRQTLARLDTVEHDLKAIRKDRQPSAEQSGAGQSSAVQSSADLPPPESGRGQGGALEPLAPPWAQASGGSDREGPRSRPE